MMTMIQEDLEVVQRITILQEEDIKMTLRTMIIRTSEVDMAGAGSLPIEMFIQEVLELTTPDATAFRVILILVTKDHRRLIRRIRCPE